MPKFEVPPNHTFDIIEYPRTSPEQVKARIKDATVLVTCVIPLNEHILSEDVCPHLEFINVMASGTDGLHLPTCKRRGITVSTVNTANVTAVSEHAIAMYFASRRKLGVAQFGMRRNEWVERSTMLPTFKDRRGDGPLVCEEEIVGIIGYGPIGKRVHALASSLGMKVLIANRKGASSMAPHGRTDFRTLVKESTVIVCSVPRNEDTIGLISHDEFQVMRPEAVLINVSRGGVVDEAALLEALKAKRIFGAGLDVWASEPAGPVNTALLQNDTAELNLITTPHTAWFAAKTFRNYQTFLKENLLAWIAGSPVRVAV